MNKRFIRERKGKPANGLAAGGSSVSFYFSFKLEFLFLNGPVPMANEWAAKRERSQCTTVAITSCSHYSVPFGIQAHVFSILFITYFHIFLVSKFTFKCDDFHFVQSLTCIFNRAFVKIPRLRQLTVYRQVQITVQHSYNESQRDALFLKCI